jgi:hypothetical protein
VDVSLAHELRTAQKCRVRRRAREIQFGRKGVNQGVKHLWTVVTVAGLLALVGSGVQAQRYTPPGGSTTSGGDSAVVEGGDTSSTSGGDTSSTDESSTETPAQHNPDPFGLTLAASGTAAAVGYVMRRRKNAS